MLWLDTDPALTRPIGGLRGAQGPASPGFVQTLQLARRPIPFLQTCQQRYGDAFRMRLVTGRRYLMFNHPRAVREIFQADEDVLKAGKAYQPLTAVLDRQSLLQSDGAAHRQRKPKIGQVLSGHASHRYVKIASHIVNAAIKQWPTVKQLKIDPLLDDLVLEVAARILLGNRDGTKIAQVKETFLQAIRPLAAASFAWLLLDRAATQWKNVNFLTLPIHRLTSLLANEISCARHGAGAQTCSQNDSGADKGIFAELVSACQSQSDLTDRGLCSDLLTVMIGIYFGLGGTLKRTLAFVTQSPDVQRRLTDELTSHHARDNAQAVAELPYLDAVCRESLRLCPSVPFALRTAMQPMGVDGYRVEQGDVVAACMTLTHRRADIYSNPDSFRPERFLDRNYSPYEYYPFGGGQKRCVGAKLATSLLKVVLAALLRNHYIESQDRRPLHFTMRGIFMVPKRKLNVRLQ